MIYKYDRQRDQLYLEAAEMQKLDTISDVRQVGRERLATGSERRPKMTGGRDSRGAFTEARHLRADLPLNDASNRLASATDRLRKALKPSASGGPESGNILSIPRR